MKCCHKTVLKRCDGCPYGPTSWEKEESKQSSTLKQPDSQTEILTVRVTASSRSPQAMEMLHEGVTTEMRTFLDDLKENWIDVHYSLEST